MVWEVASSTELARTTGWFDAPTGQPMVSVLSDGTFFASAVFYGDWTSYFRCWHLGWDLSVMGTVDIPIDPYKQWITNYTVALSDNKVFMVVGMRRDYRDGPPDTFLTVTYVIDCAAATPAVGDPLPFTPTPGNMYNTIPAYDWGDTFRLYDAATDRVVIASGVRWYASWLQVFRGSTGEFLCDISDDDEMGYEQSGLFMDPNDLTQFVIMGMDSPMNQAHFTIAFNGLSATYDGITECGVGDWILGAGSPYRTGGGGFLWEGSPGSTHVMCYSPYANPAPDYETSAVLASVVEDSLSMESAGSAVDNGRYLLSFGQQRLGTGFHGPFQGVLWCVDQMVTPPTIESLVLPYPSVPEGYGNNDGHHQYWEFTWNGEPATVDVNSQDGTVVVATTLRIIHDHDPEDDSDRDLYVLMLWTVGNGVTTSNLEGEVLSTNVYFTPSRSRSL